MGIRIKYGKGQVSFSRTKTKPRNSTNANNIHAYNVPNSADKINSTRGVFNRRRLQKENKQYRKQYENTYNVEGQIRKQNQALRYATANNLITQAFGGQTARDIANIEAKSASQMANNNPGNSQSSQKPGDVSTGSSSADKTDSTASMGWIK